MQNSSNLFDIPEMDLFDKPDLKGKLKLDTNINTKAFAHNIQLCIT